MAKKLRDARRTAAAMRQAVRTFMVGPDGIEGAALVEFTIFAPIIVVLILGVVDFGLYVYRNVQIQNAAQAGALYAIEHGYASSSLSSAVNNAACYPSASCGAGVFTGTIALSPGSPSRFCGCPSNAGVTQLAAGACTSGLFCPGGSAPGTYVSVQAQAHTYDFALCAQSYPFLLTFSTSSSCPGGANFICSTATVRIQ